MKPNRDIVCSVLPRPCNKEKKNVVIPDEVNID